MIFWKADGDASLAPTKITENVELQTTLFHHGESDNAFISNREIVFSRIIQGYEALVDVSIEPNANAVVANCISQKWVLRNETDRKALKLNRSHKDA